MEEKNRINREWIVGKQIYMYKTAKQIVKHLQSAGYIAYFAGGWVRDFLLQQTSDDIDIATNASTSEIQGLFPKTVPIGISFGIVIVVEEGMQFEVATFRRDRGYLDGRRPSGIDPALPEEDAQRRDFTINGLFYDPIAEKLYDYVGGAEDIKRGIIRAIGNPHERFAEDRLRMMRAVRYSTRFQFPIETRTEEAIIAHARELIPAVAMERIWQEFKKMSQSAYFSTGLIQLYRLHLLSTIFPSLKALSIEEISNRLRYLPHFPEDSPPFAKLLELFPKLSLPEIEQLAEYLKLSNEESAFAHFYHHAQALFAMPQEWIDRLEKYEWAEFYAHPFCAISLKMLAAHLSSEERDRFIQNHKLRQQTLASAIQRIQDKAPYLRAQDLIQEGVAPSQKLGKLLKEGMRIAINEGIEDKMLILSKLKASPLWET